MKMINKTKTTLLSTAAMGVLLITSAVQAANLTVSSTLPTLNFEDTDSGVTGSDWIVTGPTSSFNLFDRNPSFHTTLQIISGSNNTNSFLVDSSGDVNLADGSVFIDKSTKRVGIGTSTPVAGTHIADGNTPTIRLEQDGTGGFTPQSWDMAGNETNFFIRDVTNGSALPFRIKPGSPTSSIHIHPEGVGIGSSTTPEAKLHVRFSGANPTGLVQLLKLSANNTTAGKFSDAGITMENQSAGFSWAFRTLENTGGFAASKQGTGAKEFEVRNPTAVAANVELHLANGASNVGGQWLNASSRSYKENIHDLSNEEAMQTLRDLKSVKYQFKRDKDSTQRVGFIAEDVPALLATKDRKTIDPLQIIAVLTKALQVQDESLTAKDQEIAEMKTKINQLDGIQQRLFQLETILKRFSSSSADVSELK